LPSVRANNRAPRQGAADRGEYRQVVGAGLSGYYHHEHNNTVIEPGAIKRDASNLNRYCYQHGEMTVMDAVKNMGLGN